VVVLARLSSAWTKGCSSRNTIAAVGGDDNITSAAVHANT